MGSLLKFRVLAIGLTFAVTLLFVSSATHADILIAKLDDITLVTNPTRTNDLRYTERLCVASDPVGPYSLQATGSGPGGEYILQNGPDSIAFILSLRDQRSGREYRTMTPGVPLTGLLTRPLRNNQNCPGNAARLRLIIRKEVLSGSVPGTYQGSLQLTVIPE